MPETIKKLALGEILTIPIDLEVIELSTETGYRKYNKVKLVNDDLGIELCLTDAFYEKLAKGVNNYEKGPNNNENERMDHECS